MVKLSSFREHILIMLKFRQERKGYTYTGSLIWTLNPLERVLFHVIQRFIMECMMILNAGYLLRERKPVYLSFDLNWVFLINESQPVHIKTRNLLKV